MSAGSGDFANDLLVAKERDLKPLLEESAESLELDRDQLITMETFLNEAWVSGTRTGQAQVHARAVKRQRMVDPVDLAPIEDEFKDLMEASADALNLTVNRTISMWDLLSRAWIAGTQTCEAELMALLIETRSDVTAEALQWLEEEGGSPEPPKP
jgi:hypothetical protein